MAGFVQPNSALSDISSRSKIAGNGKARMGGITCGIKMTIFIASDLDAEISRRALFQMTLFLLVFSFKLCYN
jgi:hypothetical protein